MAEAPLHPHNRARGSFVDVSGSIQPVPAPRYSATPTAMPSAQHRAGADTREILRELDYSTGEIASLRRDKIALSAGRERQKLDSQGARI